MDKIRIKGTDAQKLNTTGISTYMNETLNEFEYILKINSLSLSSILAIVNGFGYLILQKDTYVQDIMQNFNKEHNINILIDEIE